MASLSRCADSSGLRVRKRVPADVLGRLGGRVVLFDFAAVGGQPAVVVATTAGADVKFSLRCRDPDGAEACLMRRAG